ncbi:MAG: DUF4126 domain-containing protein [Armatimonadetes bacterium]|nr:DUF4126 domain-containing protein [Armatimonadota bacterium]
MDFWLNVVIGICFAACSGFRAFLPLLIVAILGKLEYLHLKDSFSWLASDSSIMILGVAAVV